MAKETIEADEFAAMFADLPEPRNEPGGSPTPKLASPLTPRRRVDEDAAGSPAGISRRRPLSRHPGPHRSRPDRSPHQTRYAPGGGES